MNGDCVVVSPGLTSSRTLFISPSYRLTAPQVSGAINRMYSVRGGEAMYPLKKGKYSSQAHVGLPEGTYEEEHGRKGFYGKTAHLYHTHPPTGWIRFEGKLRPHCFDLNNLAPTDLTDPCGAPVAFLGNDDIR